MTRLTLRSIVCAGLAAGAAACRGDQDMMAPGGPAADRIAGLGWLALGIFTVAAVVMWALVFWLAVRRRGSLDAHLPHDAPENRRWIIIGGLVVPAVVFATIFVVMLRTMSAFPMGGHDAAMAPPDIRIIGHQWWWQVEYPAADVHLQVATANEIHIPAGRPVDIELRSDDVVHSFWVPRLHGKVDLVPGLSTYIRIQADAPGRFEGQCAEYCGPQHAHMRLLVIADEPDVFSRWLTGQLPTRRPRRRRRSHTGRTCSSRTSACCATRFAARTRGDASVRT